MEEGIEVKYLLANCSTMFSDFLQSPRVYRFVLQRPHSQSGKDVLSPSR